MKNQFIQIQFTNFKLQMFRNSTHAQGCGFEEAGGGKGVQQKLLSCQRSKAWFSNYKMFNCNFLPIAET